MLILSLILISILFMWIRVKKTWAKVNEYEKVIDRE